MKKINGVFLLLTTIVAMTVYCANRPVTVADLLSKTGHLVNRSGHLVATSDPSTCACCSSFPTDCSDCSTCPTSLSITVSGLTGACAADNGSGTISSGGGTSCTWTGSVAPGTAIFFHCETVSGVQHWVMRCTAGGFFPLWFVDLGVVTGCPPTGTFTGTGAGACTGQSPTIVIT